MFDMGLGKTKTAIDIAVYKYLRGEIEAVMLIAPNGVHVQWVSEQMPLHCNVEYEAFIWDSAKLGRKYYKAEGNKFFSKSDRLKLKAIPEAAVTDITVMGVGDLLTRLATCCKPVPGDAIVGYITRGKGITVHRADCTNVVNLTDTERLIPVSWGQAEQAYPVIIHLEAFDRSGLLRDIAAAVADLGISMSSVNVTTNRDHTATVIATMGIKNLSQLSMVMNKLQNIRDVLDVRREASA